MTLHTAQRIARLQQSDIRAMTRACERLGGINLGQGLGDLPAPLAVKQGAIQAIEANAATYTASEGIPELRVAIARKLARDNGIHADPAAEIVVTVGATGAFAATLQALLNPGDGVLLFEPYYGYHLNTILLTGNEPQFVTLNAPAFTLQEAVIEAAIRPNTRAIVLCTPANPSGQMLSQADIELISRVAAKHDLLVITDEIYEYIAYDGRQHISPASLPGLRDRTVMISGFSKTFSITGWRLGYVVAPAALARAINLVNDLYYVCAPAPLQRGVAAGLEQATDYLYQLKHDYQLRRDVLCEGLVTAGMRPVIPQGAYYVLADISEFGYADARSAAMALLETTGVASVPGSAFHQSVAGERLLRFCFAKDEATLRDAADRLKKFRPAAN
nr:pyridoxal phosphate-dependent aminotransferase [Chitinivorax sp. B]